MKKMIWFTTLVILFLVFIVPGILALGIKMVPTNNQPGYDYNKRLAIYGVQSLTQKFISPSKNLTAIGTSIRNPNLNNKKEVIFNLYDKDNNLIISVTINGLNIEDGAFIKFVFPPIFDSQDKEYSFTLSSPDAGPEETLEVFRIAPTSNIIKYTYEEKAYPGGIPLVTFYKPNSKWTVVKIIYTNLFSRFLPLGLQKSE